MVTQRGPQSAIRGVSIASADGAWWLASEAIMLQEIGRAAYLLDRYKRLGFAAGPDSRAERKRREAWLIHFENYEARLGALAREYGIDPSEVIG